MNFPKPERRKVSKDRAKREHAKARRECWLIVYHRDYGQCQKCFRHVLRIDDPAATEFTVGQVHEPKKRSHGADETNPDECVLLCLSCHQKAHGR